MCQGCMLYSVLLCVSVEANVTVTEMCIFDHFINSIILKPNSYVNRVWLIDL